MFLRSLVFDFARRYGGPVRGMEVDVLQFEAHQGTRSRQELVHCELWYSMSRAFRQE